MPVENQNCPQNKEKSIGLVRDNGIREDGVSMPAGTDDSRYAYAMIFVPCLIKINDMSVIVCMNPTVAFPLTVRAGLLLWTKRIHAGVEPRPGREFITN